jgi:putative endonuclease
LRAEGEAIQGLQAPNPEPAFIAASARNGTDRSCIQSAEGRVFLKQPAVYIMASRRNGTLYTGVTSNLPQRAYQHKEAVVPGFTSRYGCKLLVWYEVHETMESAILREKQIKGGSRKRKLALIESMNPSWRDLFEDIT